MNEKRLAVFISGFGSNLNVFIKNQEHLEQLLVVSSKAKAFGVVRAQENNLPCLILDKKIDWEKLHQDLTTQKIQTIFLAGFMRIVPASFIKKWDGQIYNLHPSMLPKYKGLNAIEKAYESGDDIGVTIHRVVPEVDSGEIIAQEIAIPSSLTKELNLDEVKKRVHEKEHQMVLNWLNHWVSSQI